MMFFKETAFQDFTMGKVPEEWRIENLQDLLIQLKNGLTLKQNKEQNGYPITRIETISHGVIDIERVGYAPAIKKEDAEEYRLLKGDLLFSHINSVEHVGKSALYKGTPEVLLHGMNLLLLRPNKEQITSDYLLYAIRFLKAKNLFAAIAKKAVNQASINQTELGKVKIPVPSLPEQRAIVGVLGVVDSAIEYANQIIGKTERLKRGLIQQLLTHGIGHKETKQTPIGKIPENWAIVKLADIARVERGKFAHRPRNEPRFYGGKYPFIQTGDIAAAKGLIKTYTQTLNEEGLEISRMFKKGTIVISIAGNIGDVGMLDFDACFPDSVIGITPCSEVDSFFLMYLLQYLQHDISAKAPRSTQKNINLDIIKPIKIPLPPLSEQQKISAIITEVRKKLEIEVNEKVKLEHIKRGLMDLLLTGKIRIKVD